MVATVYPVLLLCIMAYGQQSTVLFVEDNAGFGTATHPDSLWHTILTNFYGSGNFGWFGPTTNKYENGPSLQTMQDYDLVIWNNYDHYGQPLPLSPTLTATDQTNTTDYLNSGGKLWLIAQDALYSGVPLIFFQDNFELENYTPGITGVVSTHIQGLAEASGPEFLVTADYVTTTVFYADDLIPSDGAHHIIEDTDFGFYPGILKNDSTASFWTIDGRRPVLAITWEELVRDMLNIFGVVPGIHCEQGLTPIRSIVITASPRVFRDHTDICFQLKEPTPTSLDIYDIAGMRVFHLSAQQQGPGRCTITWRGNNTAGERLADGVYFIRLYQGKNAVTLKVVMLD
ncbi:MAG: FlgD immunoglobulin-like domain containing protein [candidate division WOR-3 bacterium]